MLKFHSPLLKVELCEHLLFHLPHILLLLVHFFIMVMANDDARLLGFLAVDPEQLSFLPLACLLGLLLHKTHIRSVLILHTGTDVFDL